MVVGSGKKPSFFGPNPLEDQSLNTLLSLIHNNSFRTKRFKRKTSIRNIKGGVSPQP